MTPTSHHNAWGILWRSENKLDGKREVLLGKFGHDRRARSLPDGYAPAGEAQTVLTFTTKRAAREYIKAAFGYIASCPDLRAEPHGWKVPVPVKVLITVAMVSGDATP